MKRVRATVGAALVVASMMLAPAVAGSAAADIPEGPETADDPSGVGPPGARATGTGYATVLNQGSTFLEGENHVWRPGSGAVTATGSTSDVTVRAAGGETRDPFTFRFVAPDGEQLQPGTYDDVRATAARAPGQLGLDLERDGYGCPTYRGEVTVLDVAPDLSRLHLLYVQYCHGGSDAIFGEIEIGGRAPADGLDPASSVVSWPEVEPGRRGPVVPVTFANLGAEPVVVESVRIGGRSAEFSLRNSSCRTVRPGDDCVAWVGFRPQRAGERRARLVLAVEGAAVTRVPLRARGNAGRSSWTMASGRYDFIGQGLTYRFDEPDARFSGAGSPEQIGVSVAYDDDSPSAFRATLRAAPGDELTAGTVLRDLPGDAEQLPDVQISGEGRGCNDSSGTAVVDHAVYRSGVVAELALRFVQSCDRGDTTDPAYVLTGAIEWNVGGTRSPTLQAGLGPVLDLRAQARVRGRVALSWLDPLGEVWERTVVVGARGSEAPSTPSEGERLYAGRAGRAVVEVPRRGPYALAVFTRGGGLTGPPTTLLLRAGSAPEGSS